MFPDFTQSNIFKQRCYFNVHSNYSGVYENQFFLMKTEILRSKIYFGKACALYWWDFFRKLLHSNADSIIWYFFYKWQVLKNITKVCASRLTGVLTQRSWISHCPHCYEITFGPKCYQYRAHAFPYIKPRSQAGYSFSAAPTRPRNAVSNRAPSLQRVPDSSSWFYLHYTSQSG
jgi:hypothetical protein